jgi:short-subunit dehydrogenase
MARTGKTALITGASAGLGVHFARLFASDGHDLVLVARRRDKLETLAAELRAAHGIHVTVVAADLTDPKARSTLLEEVTRAGIEVEFRVNNAGYGTNGAFAEADLFRELDMIDLNIKALTHLTGLFLPPMVERRSGRILNIGSGAGFLPGPFMAVYFASKAFVQHFTEALAHELRGSGVTATVLAPGPLVTEFGGLSGADSSAMFKAAADPADAAQHGYQAMLAGKPVAIPGLRNKLNVGILRATPRSVVRVIAAGMTTP